MYEGELQARALGAAIESWDPEGHPHIGEVGELVLTEPMPSMPIYFWGDEDGSRYREAYFDTYPGIWRHGDWIEITERGTAIITGRSDATINRGGIRMGTAEIYRAVLAVDAVVGRARGRRPGRGRRRLDAAVRRPARGRALTDEVVAEIRKRVREDCSPRHVPSDVIAVSEVPRTLSGKVLELPVKRILMGTPPEKAAARDSLANPDALDPFVELAARQRSPVNPWPFKMPEISDICSGGGSGVTPLSPRPVDLREFPCGDGDGAATRGGATAHAGRDLGLFVLAAANGLFLYFLPGQADTDYAWSIKPPVNAAFIGAGFLAGTLATGLVLAYADALADVLDAADRALGARHQPPGGDHHPRGPLQVRLPADLGLDVRVRRRAARDPVPRVAAAPQRGPEPAADPRLKPCGWCRDLRHRAARRRDRAVPRPRRPRRALAVGADAAARPRGRRLVRAFGTMLVSSAFGLRRPAEAIIGYATLACWCVLLLLLPSCTPTTSAAAGSGTRHGRAAALSAYALALAWPDRREL